MTVDNKPCVIPFEFNGKTYNGCTFDFLPQDADLPWCSTYAIYGKHIGGYRGTCSKSCPLDKPLRTISHDPLPRDIYNTLLIDIFKQVGGYVHVHS